MKKREIYMNKPIYLGQAILDISKTLMHEFGLIICYLCMMKMSNYAIWIPIVLLFMLKLMIFTKILVMILIDGFDNNEIVDTKENNTKSELDILREESKALRNNSKILGEEANTIQNNSKILTER